jgi:hypothetical protein
MIQAGLVLVLVLATPANGQWSPGGVSVCGTSGRPYFPRMAADGAGGVYVTWRDLRDYSTTDEDVYLQRITAAGTIAPGWPAGGLPLCTLPLPQDPSDLVHDGQGGVLVVWIDFRDALNGLAQDVYAQRVLGDGTIAPGWPADGAPVTRARDYQSVPVIAADGTGGAYVAWDDRRDEAALGFDVYAQHLTPTGGVAPGWPEDGLPVATLAGGQVSPRILADDDGGVVLVWSDGGLPEEVRLFGTRLRADGSVAPGWDWNTLLLGDRPRKELAADGAGGFFVGCATFHSQFIDSDGEYFAQRFGFDGAVAPGWPEGGVRVCGAPGQRGGLRVAPDGLGGLLLAWQDYRSGLEIYASRILADGSLAPGWTVDGVLVSDPSAGLSEYGAVIATDGLGGAYLAWEREGGGRRVMLQHLDAFGQLAAGWPAGGLEVIPTTTSDFDPVIASDDAGGAIVVWEYRLGSQLRAQRYQGDGPVAVALALASVVAEPERVALLWQGAGAGVLAAQVERRTTGGTWELLGTAQPEGADRLRFEDRAVTPGERYAYRLAYRDGDLVRYTPEAWVEVPTALALALEGFRPNPVVDAVRVAFTLPSAAPVRLELLDLAGRRVAEHDLGGLGPGRHLLHLDQAAHLAPGLYLLRLTHGARTLTARGAVVR